MKNLLVLVVTLVVAGQLKAEVVYPQEKSVLEEASSRLAYVLNYLSQKNIVVANDDLKISYEKKSLLGTHIQYTITNEEVEISEQNIVLTLDNENRVRRLFDSTESFEIENKGLLITKENAFALAWQALNAEKSLIFLPQAKLIYSKSNDVYKMAYKVSMSVESPYGHWDVLVNANNGSIISVKRQMAPTKKSKQVVSKSAKKRAGEVLSYSQALQNLKNKLAIKALNKTLNTFKKAVGSARVFDPNPNTVLNSDSIRNNSSRSAFEPAYSEVELVDLTVDGDYQLKNNDIELTDFDSPSNVVSTSENGLWSNNREERGPFLDTMTFFHLQKSINYLKDLGFVGERRVFKSTIEVDSNGAGGADNSFFSPSRNALSFGHGCVPDNEDADVILHELGHAIQHNIAGSNWSGGDTGAMGEGFGDYWAASYSYTTVNGKQFNPDWVFKWDGHNSCWDGRLLNKTNMQYSHSRRYGAHSRVSGGVSDELWSTPIFQAFKELYDRGVSRDDIDKIIIESHFGLGRGLKMRDMANVIVETARELFPESGYAEVYVKHFEVNNIL